jgi:hypothetical protein
MSTVALVGLPGAGKTTYAVVLAVACEAAKDGMCVTKYAGVGNRQYLNARAAELARCVELERTKQGARDEIRLRIKLAPDSPERELLMPDLSGEFLRDSMADRALHEDLHELIETSAALLLFVRTDQMLGAETINDFNELLREVGEQPGGENIAPEAPEDWYVELASTQAQLTDIVQELVRLRAGRPLRLGLILSAWDSQATENLKPGDWAARHLPLLVQTLDSEPLVAWEVFGVSAQGGDFAGPERAELEELDVADRPKLQRRDGQQVGIGAPVQWALESQ